ncbi:MAG: sigma-70 family RNA polymerase sigma factor [Phycisphaerales bacterium]|nr:sigma-70 family RNA polymerase sigma factor [Phycisphaerales bacterium]
MTVHQITAAIASGDPEAFARLYRDRFDAVYDMARRTTRRDEAFCLDVVQDVMLRVSRCLPVMETDDDVDRWLQVAVRCAARDRFRAEQRRRRREHRASTTPAATDARPTADARRELDERLAALEPTWLEPLIMRYRFGWTLQRIATALGLSTSTVDGRLRHAVDRLGHDLTEIADDA